MSFLLKFMAFVDAFIPSRMLDNWQYNEKQKARMIVISGLFGMVVPFILLFGSSGFPEQFLVIFYSIWVLSIYSIFSFRILDPSLKFVGSVSSLGLTLILISFTLTHEVFFSATFGWYTSSVIISVFMVGWRWGLFNFSLFVGTLIYSYMTSSFNEVAVPAFWDQQAWIANYKNDQILSLTFNTGMILIFLFTKNKSEAELIESQSTIQAQQESLFKEARMAELGKVAGGIAHEINNPMTVILANAQKVRRNLLQEEFDKDLLVSKIEKIESTCLRITKIIDGLKNYSRDGSRDPIESVNMSSMFEDLNEIFKDKMHQNEIDFSIDSSVAAPAVLGRYSQIYQVLVNLLNNSIDALEGHSEKVVQVLCEHSREGSVLIHVIDSGDGIPKEIEEKIFLPFFTTKPLGVGTGLGLSISFGILKDLGGSLSFDRSHGDSRFTLRLRNAGELDEVA